MNVSVGKDFEEFVKGKVASGDYASVSEVVRDGLHLLKERERFFEIFELLGENPDIGQAYKNMLKLLEVSTPLWVENSKREFCLVNSRNPRPVGAVVY